MVHLPYKVALQLEWGKCTCGQSQQETWFKISKHCIPKLLRSLLHHYYGLYYVFITSLISHYYIVITSLIHHYYIIITNSLLPIITSLSLHCYVIVTLLLQMAKRCDNEFIITHYCIGCFHLNSIITNYHHYYLSLGIWDQAACRCGPGPVTEYMLCAFQCWHPPCLSIRRRCRPAVEPSRSPLLEGNPPQAPTCRRPRSGWPGPWLIPAGQSSVCAQASGEDR